MNAFYAFLIEKCLLKTFLFFDIMSMVKDMGWFTSKPKKALNSKTMASLVYESVRIRSGEIEPIFDQAGVVYDEVENQLVIMGINYEILNWELRKTTSKEIVDAIMDMAYKKFYYSLQIDKDRVLQYQEIMNRASKKADEILFVKYGQKVPKSVLLYKLILELEEIQEVILEPSTRKSIELLIEGWFQVAKAINTEYKVVDTPEDIEKNKPIDFDF